MPAEPRIPDPDVIPILLKSLQRQTFLDFIDRARTLKALVVKQASKDDGPGSSGL